MSGVQLEVHVNNALIVDQLPAARFDDVVRILIVDHRSLSSLTLGAQLRDTLLEPIARSPRRVVFRCSVACRCTLLRPRSPRPQRDPDILDLNLISIA